MQLRIRSIETIPVRVTLEKLYRGSHYKMPRRCTIITRVVTEEGIVGQTYNADADEEQAEIIRIVQEELAPIVVGRDALASSSAGSRCAGSPSTNCATGVLPCRPLPASTLPSGTPSAKRWGCLCTGYGGASATPCR